MQTLTREQKKMALAPFMDDDVRDDLWGTSMAHLCAIADTLLHVCADPSEWGYRSPSGSSVPDVLECQQETNHEEDCDCDYAQIGYVAFLDAGDLGISMLRYAGNVISRVTRREERAGRSY